MENDGPVAPSLEGRTNETRGDLLDAVATIDRLLASLTATRAELIDGTRSWIESAENLGRRPGRHGWTDAKVAHRVLVSELSAVLRISEREAARLVAESETLVTELPATLDVLREGRISYRHAAAIIDQAWSLPAGVRAAFAAELLPSAERMGVGPFARLARRRREIAHPASAITRRQSAFERRSVAVDPAHDGMAWLSAYLPAEQAIGIDDRLDRIAAAQGALDEPRTFAQLRADALAELLLTGADGSGGDHAIQAQILVTVPVLTLLGSGDEPAELEGFGPIDPQTARRLAGGSTGFTRLLTHPETGVVLSVGRDRYAVPSELRRAARARDESCRMIGCQRRAASCDLDHTTAWEHGGDTALDNLAHLCRTHHQLKHHGGWAMAQRGGGAIDWTSPTGRSYTTQPARQVATPRVMRT